MKPRIIVQTNRWHRIDVFHYLGEDGNCYACPPRDMTWTTVVEDGKHAEYARLSGQGWVSGAEHRGPLGNVVDNPNRGSG